ncbi:unnamed protein product [Malus baccata var. baccata]
MGSGQSSESSDGGNDRNPSYNLGAIAAGAAAGIGVLAWGLSEKKKMMKAPGKDKIIEREGFERDPKGYFRGLRNK